MAQSITDIKQVRQNETERESGFIICEVAMAPEEQFEVHYEPINGFDNMLGRLYGAAIKTPTLTTPSKYCLR